jgi:hypothetical protein
MTTGKQNMESGKWKPYLQAKGLHYGGLSLTPKLSNTDTFSHVLHGASPGYSNKLDNENLMKPLILRIFYKYLYAMQYVRISVSGMMGGMGRCQAVDRNLPCRA